MNLINSFFEVFKTLVYFIQFIIVFRNEIWAIRTSSLDNYFKTQKNCALFQKRIFSYGIIAIKICQWISQRIDILGYNTIKALEIFQKSIPYTPLTFHDKLLYKNFKYIDSHCIGSGSISQVHKAINNKGKQQPKNILIVFLTLMILGSISSLWSIRGIKKISNQAINS